MTKQELLVDFITSLENVDIFVEWLMREELLMLDPVKIGQLKPKGDK